MAMGLRSRQVILRYLYYLARLLQVTVLHPSFPAIFDLLNIQVFRNLMEVF